MLAPADRRLAAPPRQTQSCPNDHDPPERCARLAGLPVAGTTQPISGQGAGVQVKTARSRIVTVLSRAQVALVRLTPRSRRSRPSWRGLVITMDTADRDAIYAELRRARVTFRRLVQDASPGDLARTSYGTRWTNQQLLFHILFCSG